MAVIKRIIPIPVRSFYQKVRWFFRYYTSINKFSKIQATHFLGPLTYDTDSLATSNNADFINEFRFARAYAAAAATNPWAGFTLQWRVYIVCWFANHVRQLEGDFIECGVNTGAYARAVIEYIDFNTLGKTFFLFDTFEGFPELQLTEREKKLGLSSYGGDHYKDVFQRVKSTFAPFNVAIIKGMVPQTLDQCKVEKVAYLSIDMNAVAPEIAAAEYFWDKIVKGGVLILDDYGFPMHIEQKKAFDNFAASKGVHILCLPTGQGIIIK